MVKCFNPYSSGFSIYLLVKQEVKVLLKKLQSLFTWIFYLFKILKELNEKTAKIQNNKNDKATEERIVELYKLLKKAMNSKIFTVIKLIDETK